MTIGVVSASIRNYDVVRNKISTDGIKINEGKDFIFGHKTQPFRSTYRGKSVHGIVGLNSFPQKKVSKSKFNVGHSDEYFYKESKQDSYRRMKNY